MGNTMKCDNITKNKELIISALKMSGYEDMEKLAKCIEEGKVSINGCTTFNVETDKVLAEIIDKYKSGPPRELARLLSSALRTEANAVASYHRTNNTFYERMRLLQSGGQIEGLKKVMR